MRGYKELNLRGGEDAVERRDAGDLLVLASMFRWRSSPSGDRSGERCGGDGCRYWRCGVLLRIILRF